jgi:hypothetical protein
MAQFSYESCKKYTRLDDGVIFFAVSTVSFVSFGPFASRLHVHLQLHGIEIEPAERRLFKIMMVVTQQSHLIKG